jgi:hypothetical protein
MIFPKLTLEKVLQVGDKTRLNASQSFATQGENITGVFITPEDGEAEISVYSLDQEKWFLDWAYDTDGEKSVTVRILTSEGDKSKSYLLDVLSPEDDALLSSDSDLFPYEPTIYKYLPVGKNSFKYAHRAAQSKILAYLDEQRIWKNDGSRYSKMDLTRIEDSEFKEQFRMWSTFQTLLIIFESSQISVGDVFKEKRVEYEKEMRIHRNRASLRLDADDDGVIDQLPRNIRTTRLVRR